MRGLEVLGLRGMGLSTPHGALGTQQQAQHKEEVAMLSTPHGALGTILSHL